MISLLVSRVLLDSRFLHGCGHSQILEFYRTFPFTKLMPHYMNKTEECTNILLLTITVKVDRKAP